MRTHDVFTHVIDLQNSTHVSEVIRRGSGRFVAPERSERFLEGNTCVRSALWWGGSHGTRHAVRHAARLCTSHCDARGRFPLAAACGSSCRLRHALLGAHRVVPARVTSMDAACDVTPVDLRTDSARIPCLTVDLNLYRDAAFDARRSPAAPSVSRHAAHLV